MAKTVGQIKWRIQQLQRKIKRLEAALRQPADIPGPFVTGASNYSKSLSERLDQQNERRARTFSDLQQANDDLKHQQTMLEGIEAGELHTNGQPRADAPSRQRRTTIQQTLNQFMRDQLQVGQNVALVANLHNQITIKRINTKTVTDEAGEKWAYKEMWLLHNGEPMADDELKCRLWQWNSAQTRQ